MNGYTGKILRVDLTTRQVAIEELPAADYRRYVGGSGLIGYYLLKEIPTGADPLGPENVLIFAGGPVTGVPIAGSGRSAVGGKSPLSGGYGEADVGGFFGAEMRRAGFDAIIVKGKASSPVYLYLHDGEAEIRPAEHLWGMETLECQEAVRAELNQSRARLAMIGPAGEKLVRYACVINDLKHAAGRTGMGAVMGSKNLKAVAAVGKTAVPVADEQAVRALAKSMTDTWKQKAGGMHELGTAAGVNGLSAVGALPTRNFQDGQFAGAAKISGETMRDTVLIDRGGCYACPIRCKRVVQVDDDEYQVNPEYGGPEYETIGSMGSNCGVDDIRAVSKANELCNAYGLDTIAAGMAVSFAMECYENELLTPEDTGGLELRFGNGPAMVEMIRRIGEREGLGYLLAEGPTRAAERIGNGAEAFVIDVKKQPYPMHECRTRHGQALGYAVSPTGADHMHNFWDEAQVSDPLDEGLQGWGVYVSVPQTVLNADKVRAYTLDTNWKWLGNELGMCAFIPWSQEELVQIVQAITGWHVNAWELMRSGERCVTLARVFNLREGLGRADDVLPLRMRNYHVSGTLNEEPVLPEVLDAAVSVFYGMMGWDAQRGVPTDGTLDGLDIAWVKDAAPGVFGQ